MRFPLFAILLLILHSCSAPNEMVKFQPKSGEIYTNNNLKSFLSKNPRTNIVLRVPNITEQVTTKQTSDKMIATNDNTGRDLDVYYNAIEKELLKAGFSVRDRGLFNQILGSNHTLDYSQIKELTNTDLIIEVVKINPAIKYETNTSYTINKKGNEVNKTNPKTFAKYGASAEFKIIMVKTNEMAGTYTFNYAPCVQGCALTSFKSSPIATAGTIFSKKNAAPIEPYEGVEKNIMEDFIRRSTQDLITAMKN